MTIAARKRKPSSPCDDASVTLDGNTRPAPPKIDGQDVGMAFYSSVASDESWARGFFEQHPGPADMKGGNGKKNASPSTGAAVFPAIPTALSAAPPAPGEAFELGAAFGVSVGKEEHPTGLELLCASELEAAKAAGLLDAVDELLGETVLEGFGEASSEEG